jgi:hypothetical protein
LLTEARQKSIELFTNALTSNLQQIDRFAKANSDGDLVAKPGLATQARSILNNHVQLKAALGAARSQEALVYALEATGPSQEQLTALSREPTVSGVATKGGGMMGGALKPAAHQSERKDPVVAALGSAELRVAMLAALRNSAGGAGR